MILHRVAFRTVRGLVFPDYAGRVRELQGFQRIKYYQMGFQCQEALISFFSDSSLQNLFNFSFAGPAEHIFFIRCNGILDVDIHGPSVPRLLGASASVMADENGKMLPVPCGERMSLISMDSFLKDKDTAILWRGPKKTGAIRQFLTDVQWGALDYLVIDSPPGTGDEHLTVLDAIPDAGCIVVTTPQEISLADVRKALDFLKQVQAPVLGIVENMSGLSCPHCGKEIDLFKKGGGEQLAKQYELPFLGAIPLDPATVIAADRGVPVVSLTENSPARQGFMALADAVIAATEAE